MAKHARMYTGRGTRYCNKRVADIVPLFRPTKAIVVKHGQSGHGTYTRVKTHAEVIAEKYGFTLESVRRAMGLPV